MTDLKELEAIARANGYWHHIEPFVARLVETEKALRISRRFMMAREGGRYTHQPPVELIDIIDHLIGTSSPADDGPVTRATDSASGGAT
jgi:hypothetical protein